MARKPAVATAFPLSVIVLALAAGCVGEVSAPPGIGEGTGQGTSGSGKGGTAGTSGLTGSFGGDAAATGSAAGTAGVTGGAGLTGGSGPTAGTTGTAGATGTGTGGAGGSSSAGSNSGLPCDVQTLLSNRCWSCHGTIPAQVGLPTLVTRANLMAPSTSDPSKTNAQLAVTRMQNTLSPMPPAPASRATTTEITALGNWIAAGYPSGSCGGGTGGAGGNTGAGGAATGSGGNTGTGGVAGGSDPFSVAPKCTSMSMWTRGNQGSQSMNPGMACINCHSTGEGPRFTIAGTLYPTGHEPDRCNGVNATTGAQVVIIGADGRMLTLTPNSAGNFYSQSAVATPFQAKVVYMGRERVMIAKQTSGDCNSCHTQNGANAAPGRIALP